MTDTKDSSACSGMMSMLISPNIEHNDNGLLIDSQRV